MSVFRRIADAVRDRVGDDGDQKMTHEPARIGDKPLSELSDRELADELARRRRRRGGSSASSASHGDDRRDRAREAIERVRSRERDTARERRLRQWYANLELKPGASTVEIERKYRELIARYHPDKHPEGSEKHRAAQALTAELARAYRGLLDALEQKD